jgi:selenocysteine-specific elongation factor
VDARLFQRLLSLGAQDGELAVEGDHVRLRQHAASPGGPLRDRLASVLGEAGLTPPSLHELPELAGATAQEVGALLKLLVADRRVVRVSAELYFDAAAVAGLETRLVAFLTERRSITTQEFKSLVGATRKHVIPLAEHFDREKVTLRVGEQRVLRGQRGT